jgi:hypothetical protein
MVYFIKFNLKETHFYDCIDIMRVFIPSFYIFFLQYYNHLELLFLGM